MSTRIKTRFLGKGFLSLQIKSILFFSLLFLGIFLLGLYWVYSYSTRLARNEIYDSTLVTARLLASHIDGEPLEGLIQNPDYDPSLEWPMGMKDERYWEISQMLYDAHRIMPQAYPYTYVPSGVD